MKWSASSSAFPNEIEKLGIIIFVRGTDVREQTLSLIYGGLEVDSFKEAMWLIVTIVKLERHVNIWMIHSSVCKVCCPPWLQVLDSVTR